MFNSNEKIVERVRQAVKDLNEGHINVYTFAARVQGIVEPNLYSSVFTEIANRAMDEGKEKTWDTVLVCPNCKVDYGNNILDTQRKDF